MQLDFQSFPELVSEHLLLRSLQPSDANAVFALRSDDNVNKYIDRPKAKTIEDAEQFITKILNSIQNNQCLWWAVELKTEGVFAGAILLWNINKEKNEAEIGYELLPQYHGKGIIQEAIEAVLKFGFDLLKFNSIVAIVHRDNIPSIKTLQRNNFEVKTEMEDSLLEYILYAENFNKKLKIISI